MKACRITTNQFLNLETTVDTFRWAVPDGTFVSESYHCTENRAELFVEKILGYLPTPPKWSIHDGHSDCVEAKAICCSSVSNFHTRPVSWSTALIGQF